VDVFREDRSLAAGEGLVSGFSRKVRRSGQRAQNRRGWCWRLAWGVTTVVRRSFRLPPRGPRGTVTGTGPASAGRAVGLG